MSSEQPGGCRSPVESGGVLAPFQNRLEWCRHHLCQSSAALEDLPPLPKVRLACSLHLDLKMVPFLEKLSARGAQLYLTSCNPATSDPDSLDHLRAQGFEVDLEDGCEQRAWEWGPTHLCELGAGLSEVAHKAGLKVVGSMEGTGSGIARFKRWQLPYPIVNWDEVDLKRGLHNRYMVGLTAWHTFFSRTGLTLHGKRVAVLGFGPVGRGLAEAARAYGGRVEVIDPNPTRALEARFSGWAVEDPATTLKLADVVATATGARKVLGQRELEHLKDGCFLVNVGHTSDEIDLDWLGQYSEQEVMPFIHRFDLPNKALFVLARGSMVNLTAGFGDSLNSFDVTLTIMARTLEYLLLEAPNLAPGLHRAPDFRG